MIVLFYEVYLERSLSEYKARSIGRYFVFMSKRPIRRRNNSSHGKHEVVNDIFKFLQDTCSICLQRMATFFAFTGSGLH